MNHYCSCTLTTTLSDVRCESVLCRLCSLLADDTYQSFFFFSDWGCHKLCFPFLYFLYFSLYIYCIFLCFIVCFFVYFYFSYCMSTFVVNKRNKLSSDFSRCPAAFLKLIRVAKVSLLSYHLAFLSSRNLGSLIQEVFKLAICSI